MMSAMCAMLEVALVGMYVCISISIYIYMSISCNNVQLFSKIIKNIFLFCIYFAAISCIYFTAIIYVYKVFINVINLESYRLFKEILLWFSFILVISQDFILLISSCLVNEVKDGKLPIIGHVHKYEAVFGYFVGI